MNGTGLRVEEVGVGAQTVVFSPSLYTNREMFEAPVAVLRGDYRCVSYDHRGQGGSGFGAHQASRHLFGVESLYADAVALLDQLGVERCHWVGASLGTFIGMRLAARHPDRVRSLVLIGPVLPRASRAELLQIDLSGWLVRATHPLGPVGIAVRRAMAGQIMRYMFGSAFMADPARAAERERWQQRFFDQLVPQAVPMLREVTGHPPTDKEMLGRIQAPTLVLVGDDKYAGTAAAEETQQAITGADLMVIPGAGHVVLVEQPEAATTAIAEFIRGVDEG